jgi:hypothetical protein
MECQHNNDSDVVTRIEIPLLDKSVPGPVAVPFAAINRLLALSLSTVQKF